MKLVSIYVVGELEYIAQHQGNIIIRTRRNRKVKVYEGGKELEEPFKGLCAVIPKKQTNLSHPIGIFSEGDKVRLTRFVDEKEDFKDNYDYDEEDDEVDNGKYRLENLTLSKLSGLEALEPKKSDGQPFSIGVIGTLVRLGYNRGKNVAIRINCSKKIYTFFDKNNKMSKKEAAFEKTIYGEIPKDELRLDLCIDTYAVYKEGDTVSLSRLSEGSFDLDNLTMSIMYGSGMAKYQTELELRP